MVEKDLAEQAANDWAISVERSTFATGGYTMASADPMF
jgi:hypothetical protein